MSKYDITDEDLVALAKQPKNKKKATRGGEKESIERFIKDFQLQKGEYGVRGKILYDVYCKWCSFPYGRGPFYKHFKSIVVTEDDVYFINKTKEDLIKATLYLKEECEENLNTQD